MTPEAEVDADISAYPARASPVGFYLNKVGVVKPLPPGYAGMTRGEKLGSYPVMVTVKLKVNVLEYSKKGAVARLRETIRNDDEALDTFLMWGTMLTAYRDIRIVKHGKKAKAKLARQTVDQAAARPPRFSDGGG